MSNDLPGPHPSISRHRPVSVTILAVGVLILAGFNLLRFYQAVRYWDFISEFPTVSPLYLVVSGFLWGTASLLLAWGLWRGYTLAWRLAFFYAVAYTLYYWIDRLLVSSSDLPANLPFLAGLNLIVLLVTSWILTRPGVRLFFGVMHEQ